MSKSKSIGDVVTEAELTADERALMEIGIVRGRKTEATMKASERPRRPRTEHVAAAWSWMKQMKRYAEMWELAKSGRATFVFTADPAHPTNPDRMTVVVKDQD